MTTHANLFRAMQDPGFYPEKPERIEVIQTHASYVFLAGNRVYKVKKAMDFCFLDFSTLEKRRHFCEEELRLNRRLAPKAYLDMVPITERGDGGLELGGDGPVVEYAVKMVRLPEERMLKRLIGRDDFDPAVLDAVARKVAAFHREAATGGVIDEMGRVETIHRNHEENFSQTEKYIGITIPEHQNRLICRYDRRFLQEKAPLFEQRVAEGFIRDCHGDLHLEHVVIGDDDVTIFDAIEFNERFRFGDVAAEVAFMAMDLEFNGYGAYADRFVKAYIRYSGAEKVQPLLNFYKCYYAYCGQVSAYRLDDPDIEPADREAAKEMARRYFDLAYTCAARPERPVLLLTTGLSGTGKSVIARELAPRLDAEILQTDVMRKELLGIVPTERHMEAFGAGIYSEEVSARTYDEAIRRARAHLETGRSVIIDASFKRCSQREAAVHAARGLGSDCWVVACQCPIGRSLSPMLVPGCIRRRWESTSPKRAISSP
jgi:aminoglycoside phosphotransferase family enzyme/predicted kinase